MSHGRQAARLQGLPHSLIRGSSFSISPRALPQSLTDSDKYGFLSDSDKWLRYELFQQSTSITVE